MLASAQQQAAYLQLDGKPAAKHKRLQMRWWYSMVADLASWRHSACASPTNQRTDLQQQQQQHPVTADVPAVVMSAAVSAATALEFANSDTSSSSHTAISGSSQVQHGMEAAKQSETGRPTLSAAQQHGDQVIESNPVDASHMCVRQILLASVGTGLELPFSHVLACALSACCCSWALCATLRVLLRLPAACQPPAWC